MANSGWTADPDDLTLPPGAGKGDARIYLGPNDPIAEELSQDAAIVFYWAEERAFVLSVEHSGGTRGQLHLWSTTPDGSVQWIDFDHPDDNANDASGAIGQRLRALSISPAELEIVPTTHTLDDIPQAVPELYLGGYNYTEQLGPMVDTIYYGRSAGRGLIASVNSNASTGAISTTETALLTIPSRTYYAGRAYELTTKGGVTYAAATTHLLMRARKTGVGGQDLGEFYRPAVNVASATVVFAASWGLGAGVGFKVGADNITAAIALTGVTVAAGTAVHYANAVTRRNFKVWDVGAADDFPDFATLT